MLIRFPNFKRHHQKALIGHMTRTITMNSPSENTAAIQVIDAAVAVVAAAAEVTSKVALVVILVADLAAVVIKEDQAVREIEVETFSCKNF